ncbi:MAG: hypothetical protein Q7S93_16850 [Phenylobacterium sp.]|uniref:hypothetical protein n=1 Tax=Phenylobacterium sp. TaxID=1871053 RepID=UPI00271CA221|nr:hypothetical protein [Phenylobacterium sp.]MDO8411724.1 hypothetical protein [Phenylobacterium sp.]
MRCGPFASRAWLGVLAAASLGGAASAQEVSGWYPFLGERIKLSPSSERIEAADYKPREAGYVQLVVEPANVQAAASCGQDKRGWRQRLHQLWGDISDRKTTWGAGVRISYPGVLNTQPKIEVLPLQITRYSSASHCRAESNNSPVRSPLLRVVTGGASPSVEVISWKTKSLEAARVKEMFAAASSISVLAGVPAGIASVTFGEKAQTVFLEHVSFDIQTGHSETFEVGSADPQTGGAKVVHVYLGAPARTMADWRPDTGNEPRMSVRLISVGSAFDTTAHTYPDLSGRSASQLLDDVLWRGKTVRAYLREVAGTNYEGLTKAQTLEAFDAQCPILRNWLRESSGLSAVDSAIVMWAVAQSNPTLTPPGLDFAKAPAVKSHCLAEDAVELARVRITIPTPIEIQPPPTRVAATSDQMINALEAMATVAAYGAETVPAFARQAAFGESLTILDPSRRILGGEMVQQTLEGNAVIGDFVRTRFETLGCWLPFEQDPGAAFWPIGFAPPSAAPANGAHTLAAAIGRVEGGDPVLLLAEFQGVETGKAAQIARLSADGSFNSSFRSAFRTRYPSARCAAAALAPSVFQ